MLMLLVDKYLEIFKKEWRFYMDTVLSLLFLFFLIVYTLYHFSRPIDCVKYEKVAIFWGDFCHCIYYKDDQQATGEGIKKYILKDKPDEDFQVIVSLKMDNNKVMKIDYFTPFGLSRVDENSFLKKVVTMSPSKGRVIIKKIITLISLTNNCPYKIE